MTVDCILQFKYQRKNNLWYARKIKRHDIIFSVIELFPLPAHLSRLKYLLWGNSAIILSAEHKVVTLQVHPPPTTPLHHNIIKTFWFALVFIQFYSYIFVCSKMFMYVFIYLFTCTYLFLMPYASFSSENLNQHLKLLLKAVFVY